MICFTVLAKSEEKESVASDFTLEFLVGKSVKVNIAFDIEVAYFFAAVTHKVIVVLSMTVISVAVIGSDSEYQSFAFQQLEVSVNCRKADIRQIFFY